MRVAELAELTGTTARTIRYYHGLGLLPVPEKRDGWRDYDLLHVARLSRIRWLSDAGVPLATIGELLAAEPVADDASHRAGVLADLHGTLAAVEEQLTRLQAQRERLGRLVASVESGAPLTPMPPPVVDFYGRLLARAGDDGTRRAIRDERDFVELAYYRGQIPPEAELLYMGIDETALQESLAAFGRERDAVLTDEQIEEIAAGVVARMRARFGPDLAAVSRRIDLDRVRSAYALYARTVTGPDQLVAEAVMRRLEAAMLEWRSS